MLSPTRGLPLDAFAPNRTLSSLTRQSGDAATVSFDSQLAGALDRFLPPLPGADSMGIDVAPHNSPNSAVRQFLVTVDAPVPAAAEAEALQAPVFRDQADAYWAMQPKEVQALRGINDPAERGILGAELAQKGFKIDNEIMILGWDPYMTMKVRKELGYSWFPSLGQSLTPVQPGLSFPGLPSYDPMSPPPGSITVSTDFANGLEHTSVCGRAPGPVTNFSSAPSLTAI